MKCKLCLKEKKLLSQSHLVPNYFEKNVIDSKHRLVMVNIDGQLKKKISQTSFWESGILCSNCDNKILSSLENYAKLFLFDPLITLQRISLPPIYKDECYKVFANHGKVKLFLLSILWRFSISKKYRTYINLGSEQENIRKMIIENDPKSPKDYPFIIRCLLNNQNYSVDSIASKLFLAPVKGSLNSYVWVFPGFFIEVFFFEVPEFIHEFYINPYEFLIVIPKKGNEESLVKKFFVKRK